MEPLWRSEQILNGPAIHFSRGTSLCWLVVLHMRCRTKNAVGCSRRQLLSYRVQLPRASYRVFWQAPHASYGPPRARRRGPPPRGGALRCARQAASSQHQPRGGQRRDAAHSLRCSQCDMGRLPRAQGLVIYLLLLPASCPRTLALAAHSAHAVCPDVEPQTCFHNAEPGFAHLPASTAAVCCALCQENATCVSWTFIGPGGDAHCNLKGTAPAAGEKVHGKVCTSGVVKGNPGPPAPPVGPVPPVPPAPKPPAPEGALNVLFMVIDDLRPELNGAYGQTFLHTPNLDKFKETSLTFERAYVQYSHCSPSRNSFLSGRSPQTTGVYNFINHFREPDVGAGWTAMPQFFKQHGWYAAGGGKVRC
jgi:hypothetical protein